MLFFGAEDRAEREDLAVRHRPGLGVQLAGLAQVGLLVKVVGFKQLRRPFWRTASQNRRVHFDEAFLVEEFISGPHHFVADLLDRELALAAQPQVPVVE